MSVLKSPGNASIAGGPEDDIGVIADSPLSEAVSGELAEKGWTFIPSVLSDSNCDLLSSSLDEIWEREQSHPDHACDEVGVQFTGNVLKRSALFELCITDDRVLDAVRTVIGPEIRLSLMHGRRVNPGFGNQPLHDLNRRRGHPFFKCNTALCLDEFTLTNGSTRVIPGTHLDDRSFFSRLDDPYRAHPDEVLATAPRGSVVIMNSHLIHGGSTNNGTEPRRCIHSAFVRASEPMVCDWSQLPPDIVGALGPDTLLLLGLQPSAPRSV